MPAFLFRRTRVGQRTTRVTVGVICIFAPDIGITGRKIGRHGVLVPWVTSAEANSGLNRALLERLFTSETLSRAAHHRPHAEPKSASFASASRSGPRVRSGARLSLGFSYRGTLAHALHDPSVRVRNMPAQKRDLSHAQSGCQRTYRIVPQCVAYGGNVSSNDRERVASQFTGCLTRGPDNGKPVERPGRKATRLQRRVSRHARRAAERSFGRGI